ncbi:hypothetical protein DFH27DRAFT_608485 [Peziza echinospora]|nr:hypothetical protein DFH27DRAFT_608485 [Peziza echinospora]
MNSQQQQHQQQQQQQAQGGGSGSSNSFDLYDVVDVSDLQSFTSIGSHQAALTSTHMNHHHHNVNVNQYTSAIAASIPKNPQQMSTYGGGGINHELPPSLASQQQQQQQAHHHHGQHQQQQQQQHQQAQHSHHQQQQQHSHQHPYHQQQHHQQQQHQQQHHHQTHQQQQQQHQSSPGLNPMAPHQYYSQTVMSSRQGMYLSGHPASPVESSAPSTTHSRSPSHFESRPSVVGVRGGGGGGGVGVAADDSARHLAGAPSSSASAGSVAVGDGSIDHPGTSSYSPHHNMGSLLRRPVPQQQQQQMGVVEHLAVDGRGHMVDLSILSAEQYPHGHHHHGRYALPAEQAQQATAPEKENPGKRRKRAGEAGEAAEQQQQQGEVAAGAAGGVGASSSSLSSRAQPGKRTATLRDSTKQRGRPRLDTRDETAADRRRTQIRLAQRAYRMRKETTISSLRTRVNELEAAIDGMQTAFLELHDAAAAAVSSPQDAARGAGGVEGDLHDASQQPLTVALRSITERFLALTRAAAAKGGDGGSSGEEDAEEGESGSGGDDYSHHRDHGGTKAPRASSIGSISAGAGAAAAPVGKRPRGRPSAAARAAHSAGLLEDGARGGGGGAGQGVLGGAYGTGAGVTPSSSVEHHDRVIRGPYESTYEPYLRQGRRSTSREVQLGRRRAGGGDDEESRVTPEQQVEASTGMLSSSHSPGPPSAVSSTFSAAASAISSGGGMTATDDDHDKEVSAQADVSGDMGMFSHDLGRDDDHASAQISSLMLVAGARLGANPTFGPGVHRSGHEGDGDHDEDDGDGGDHDDDDDDDGGGGRAASRMESVISSLRLPYDLSDLSPSRLRLGPRYPQQPYIHWTDPCGVGDPHEAAQPPKTAPQPDEGCPAQPMRDPFTHPTRARTGSTSTSSSSWVETCSRVETASWAGSWISNTSLSSTSTGRSPSPPPPHRASKRQRLHSQSHSPPLTSHGTLDPQFHLPYPNFPYPPTDGTSTANFSLLSYNLHKTNLPPSLPLPSTFAHHAPTFSQRWHRFSLERALSLIANLPQEVLRTHRAMRFTLLYTTETKMQAHIRMLLGRGVGESLESHQDRIEPWTREMWEMNVKKRALEGLWDGYSDEYRGVDDVSVDRQDTTIPNIDVIKNATQDGGYLKPNQVERLCIEMGILLDRRDAWSHAPLAPGFVEEFEVESPDGGDASDGFTGDVHSSYSDGGDGDCDIVDSRWTSMAMELGLDIGDVLDGDDGDEVMGGRSYESSASRGTSTSSQSAKTKSYRKSSRQRTSTTTTTATSKRHFTATHGVAIDLAILTNVCIGAVPGIKRKDAEEAIRLTIKKSIEVYAV